METSSSHVPATTNQNSIFCIATKMTNVWSTSGLLRCWDSVPGLERLSALHRHLRSGSTGSPEPRAVTGCDGRSWLCWGWYPWYPKPGLRASQLHTLKMGRGLGSQIMSQAWEMGLESSNQSSRMCNDSWLGQTYGHIPAQLCSCYLFSQITVYS